jgi:hypothetical protein
VPSQVRILPSALNLFSYTAWDESPHTGLHAHNGKLLIWYINFSRVNVDMGDNDEYNRNRAAPEARLKEGQGGSICDTCLLAKGRNHELNCYIVEDGLVLRRYRLNDELAVRKCLASNYHGKPLYTPLEPPD